MATAKSAAVAEAKETQDEYVTFTYDGAEYRVNKSRLQNDIDLLEAFEQGQMVTPLKMLMGGRQWTDFRSKPRTQKDLAELADLMWTALGINLGE